MMTDLFVFGASAALALAADCFADFLLVGADGMAPGASAVENDSCARIKASFGE